MKFVIVLGNLMMDSPTYSFPMLMAFVGNMWPFWPRLALQESFLSNYL